MEIGLSPIWGTLAKNGAYGATANRAEVPPYSAGRRAPSCVSKDGESLGAGGQTALPPYLGWSPTLPRCRDPGAGGNPVRAIRRPATHLVFLGTLERLHRWRLTSQGQPSSDVPLVTATRAHASIACGPNVDQVHVARGGSGAPRGGPWLARKTPAGCPRQASPAWAIALLGEPWRGSGPGTSPCVDGCP
jgi:hypothetical protein